jgi:hypothetical protein
MEIDCLSEAASCLHKSSQLPLKGIFLLLADSANNSVLKITTAAYVCYKFHFTSIFHLTRNVSRGRHDGHTARQDLCTAHVQSKDSHTDDLA